MKASYHQEAGDVLVDVEKTKEGATLKVGETVVVTNATEGPKVGQYTPVGGSEPADKKPAEAKK